MKIGFAGPASLKMLAEHVRDGQDLPRGYEFPPLSIWTEQLLARGHQVALFTIAPDMIRPRSFYGDRLTIHIGRQRSHGRARDLFALERHDLLTLMKAECCDIIHAHWTYEFALAALDSGRPCLITAHDAPINILRHTPDPYRLVRLWMAWSVARRARHLTAVSTHVAEHFRRYLRFRHPIHIVPNALPAQCFELGRHRFDHPRSGPFTVAAVLTGWLGLKNGPAALRAFGILRRSVPEARLLLFGQDYAPGGRAETWARSRSLSEGVTFVGVLPNRQLLERLASEADCFVHPSLEEALCVSVMEAMSLGIPVIAGKNTGGMAFLLENGRIGDLVDVRSPTAVAEALSRMALEPDRRLILGRASHESAAKRFDADVVLSQYERIYDTLLHTSSLNADAVA